MKVNKKIENIIYIICIVLFACVFVIGLSLCIISKVKNQITYEVQSYNRTSASIFFYTEKPCTATLKFEFKTNASALKSVVESVEIESTEYLYNHSFWDYYSDRQVIKGVANIYQLVDDEFVLLEVGKYSTMFQIGVLLLVPGLLCTIVFVFLYIFRNKERKMLKSKTYVEYTYREDITDEEALQKENIKLKNQIKKYQNQQYVCTYCGARFNKDSKKCPQCGASLHINSKEV